MKINIEIIHPTLRIIQHNAKWCRIENLYATSGIYSAHNLFTLRCAILRDKRLRLSPTTRTLQNIGEKKRMHPQETQNILNKWPGTPTRRRNVHEQHIEWPTSVAGEEKNNEEYQNVYTPNLYHLKRHQSYVLGDFLA